MFAKVSKHTVSLLSDFVTKVLFNVNFCVQTLSQILNLLSILSSVARHERLAL